MRQVNRITPVGPPLAYRTYQAAQPLDTTVVAACEEVGCQAWEHGWETVIDESTDLGVQQARYIRHQSGRTFRELRRDDGMTVFRFDSKQRCFAEHRTRPQLFVVRRGDWRASELERQHQNADDWVDDFKNHQDQLATRIERG